ncbi:urea ABC transporter permease subunit UrtC [Rhodospirillales bacterium]|nr:urea ABC transporter permease subunit UrtC [Rhodospirillales bacterium]
MDRLFPKKDLLSFIVIAVLLLVILPIGLDVFRLNLVSKYLTFAFVAIGLVMCWGAGGILSLGQGVFFGLGGYCMAMFLKLEAAKADIGCTRAQQEVGECIVQSTPGIPDFMDWASMTELPFFWLPFNSFPLTILMILMVPTILAYFVGLAMFKRRVGGVYFAIMTQAMAAALSILIIGNAGYIGGFNGITDLRTLHGWDIRTDDAKTVFYFVTVVLLLLALLASQLILKSKLGRVLVAMRVHEDRARFSGYDVANFKIFAFCFGALLAGIGGAMFTLNVGFIHPTFVGIVPSIEMVIFCAVGGRFSIYGAVYGALLVNLAKTVFSEAYPELWLFAMGAMFIGVVMAFPNGLAGLYNVYIEPHLAKFNRSGKPPSATEPAE